MLKKFILTLTAFACAVGLTSCGTENATYNSDEECTISISWWGGDSRHQATIEAIELFEKKYPNINVEVEYGAWNGWKNTITEELEKGNCADVIQVNYDWLATMSYDGNGFYDLEKLSKYIDFSNFSDDILQFGRRNDILNAVPVSITGRSLFYNTDIYKKAGAELPETWNDLFEIAPKFNKIGAYPLNADNNTGFTAWYLAVVYEQQKTGKDFITPDGEIGFTVEEIADSLQFYKDMVDNGIIRNITQIKQQDKSSNIYECESWINGTIGGIAEWGSSISKYQNTLENPESLEMGSLLTMNDAKNTGWFYKPSLLFAINKETEYPIQSALLFDFIYNDPECAEILGTSRGIPVSKTAYNTLESLDMLSGLAYESNNQIVNGNLKLISPYMENSDMQEYYNDAIEAVSLELLTPEEAAQGMYANIVYTLENIREGKN